MTGRRRPMTRIGELLPDAARGLGLEDELRLSRAMATFERIVAERVPAAAGACRVARIEGFAIVVEADAPIVAQELRLRGPELLAAFAATPAGLGARELRVIVARHPGRADADAPRRGPGSIPSDRS
jgi:Dna[CI] antecedent, DciA